MFQSVKLCCAALAVAAISLAATTAHARSDRKTIDDAAEVLEKFLDLKVKAIPTSLLAEAKGVAIFPGVIKVGLVVGGQHGRGVVIVREQDGSWRAPTFLTLTGGSVGWQVGAQATDVVLIFKTEKSVEGLLQGKFTIGADAAASAGPVGRRVEAATDTQLQAEIYSYSRSRGLFAGVSLEGSALQIDHEATAEYYGTNRQPPKDAWELVEMVAKATAAASEGLPQAEVLPTPAIPAQVLPAPLLPPPAGPTLAAPIPQPASDTAAIRAELARSAGELNALVDERWRRFLNLPTEVFREGPQPSAAALGASAARFDTIATDPQYRALAERPEFQATRELVRAYLDSLAAEPASRLPLPPPPGEGR